MSLRNLSSPGQLSREDDERLDLRGVFVVDFAPGLFGPFETRRLATEWASEQVSVHGDRNTTYSWNVAPVGDLDDVRAFLNRKAIR